jgi:NYN domain
VIASGDSDFSPLVSKLKENNKYVIGLGVKNSTSDLLIENCDEFIFYEDLVRGQQRPSLPVIANVPEKVQECFALLVDSILALQRENKEILWGSMVKETMKRKKPSFNETYYGFRTFSHLLEDAQRRGIVVLRRDQRSGSYIVEDLGTAASAAGAVVARPDSTSASASAPRAAEAGAVAATAGASASAAESSEAGANGRPRRRRGRGRGRGRGTGTTPGAFPESGSHPEYDDHDEGDDDGSEGDESHDSQERDPEAPVAASDGAHEAPHEHVMSPSEPKEEAKPAFSILSWIRGGAPEKAPGQTDD